MDDHLNQSIQTDSVESLEIVEARFLWILLASLTHKLTVSTNYETH